ncbi:MAG: hypothetical protein H0V67_06225 [Geodermatophilaceae bacterium]|nr:hypothetical protein [Geodermatophilaceae bacterium]
MRQGPGRGAVIGVLSGLLVTLAAVELAILECFLLPLRIGSVAAPLSIPAAVLGNLALPALAYRLTGSRAAALLPVLVWFAVVVTASVPRPEGDVIVTGTVQGMAFLILGAIAGAISIGRVMALRSTDRPSGSDSGDG